MPGPPWKTRSKEMWMNKLRGTYWRVLYLMLTILALIMAVGAPETTGW
jgi:hypothetical protein